MKAGSLNRGNADDILDLLVGKAETMKIVFNTRAQSTFRKLVELEGSYDVEPPLFF